MRFDLAGRATLAVVDADEAVTRRVRAQMDPYSPAPEPGGAADVVLAAAGEMAPREYVDVQNPAGDGVVTASDGAAHYLLERGRACSLPPLGESGAATFVYEPGFPVSRMFARGVRPAMQLAVLDHDAVAVHAASVELGGAGVVVAGWSETGKTETALAFVEEGARFVSDKWTIVGGDGTIACFPISVGIRRWVLRYLPRLRDSLPAAARLQLAASGVAAAASRPLDPLARVGKAGELAVDVIQRAIALGDRAALTPSQVRAAYGAGDDPSWTSTLGAVALLTTVPGSDVRAQPADPGWAARRLARSAAFERRPYFELQERARYAFPDRANGALEVERREEKMLAEILGRTQALDVRAPFPVDPRRVADAIARFL